MKPHLRTHTYNKSTLHNFLQIIKQRKFKTPFLHKNHAMFANNSEIKAGMKS